MAAPEFKDRLIFDTAAGEILDATRRYLLVRPDSFMGIFARLPEPARTQALGALEAAVFEHGSDSARAYLASGGGDARTLIDTIARTAPQLGWGRWTFDIAGDKIALTVDNSPFAQGYGPSDTPVCHAVAGMLRAVATLLFDAAAAARECTCTACGSAACRFEARSLESAPR